VVILLGELALGNLRNWPSMVEAWSALPEIPSVSDHRILEFVREGSLSGSGIGYTDAGLLAAARAAETQLWTFDKKLAMQAARLNLGWSS
jgi:predicted nucleic acid-binding protein